MPWSTVQEVPYGGTGANYYATLRSTLPDSANGGGPFRVTVLGQVVLVGDEDSQYRPGEFPIGATEAEWDAVFQSAVDDMVASGNWVLEDAGEIGRGRRNLTVTPTE